MPDERDRDATPRMCPACGHTNAPTRHACKVCGGVGVVSVDTWLEWKRRAASRSTSTTNSVRASLEATVALLKKRQTAQTAALVVVGETLLASIADWDKQALPPTGEERSRVYARASDWLTAAGPILNRQR